LSLIFGLGGSASVVLGGYTADIWFANNERSQMRFVAAAVASQVPLFALFLIASGETLRSHRADAVVGGGLRLLWASLCVDATVGGR